MSQIGKIVITSDFATLKEQILAKCGANNVRVFEFDDLGVDEAKAIIAEAYIAEMHTKTVLILTKRFGVEAQNSLLKIFEEPPRNVEFILGVNHKNILLATICSRMIVSNLSAPKQRVFSGLELKKLNLKDIMNFLEQKTQLEKVGELDKTELLGVINEIFTEAIEAGFEFSREELEHIKKLMFIAAFNTKSHAVLTPFLLMIEEKIRR